MVAVQKFASRLTTASPSRSESYSVMDLRGGFYASATVFQVGLYPNRAVEWLDSGRTSR